MKYTITFALFSMMSLSVYATNLSKMDTLPYREIPNYPEKYTPETVVIRMIEGLGFRYYWATEGLTAKDLAFKPSDKARTSEETIDHILGLSNIILNTMLKKVNGTSGEETSVLKFEDKRRITLENLKKASDLLQKNKENLESYKIFFKNGDKTTELPFWNLINGPIEDAVWHVGQVITFRRSSGNPFNGKASVLTGKIRN
jgi:hypothetical protein